VNFKEPIPLRIKGIKGPSSFLREKNFPKELRIIPKEPIPNKKNSEELNT